MSKIQDDKKPTTMGSGYVRLRDEFAMAAMQGIMASGLADPRSKEHFDNIAEDAYRLADSMLEQREVYNNPITPQFPKDRQQP